MHFLTFVRLCCLAALAVSLSLGEKDEINELLENIEREEFVEELQDELEARRVKLSKSPISIKPKKPVLEGIPKKDPCQHPCCDTGKFRIDLGDLSPGITENTMGSALSVQQAPGSGSHCSKKALLKVRFDKITKEPCSGICMKSPFCGRRLLRIDLELSRTGRSFPVGKQNFRMVNIGESVSNDGFGGDGNHQNNDAEADGKAPHIYVYGNDGCKSKQFPFYNALSKHANHVTVWVGNEYIRVKNDIGFDREMCSGCLFSLNGQPDKIVNEEIFIKLNGVISGRNDRNGHGICGASLSWECGWHEK